MSRNSIIGMADFEKCAADHVGTYGMFFYPQTHTDRGIAFETVIQGFYSVSVMMQSEAWYQLTSHYVLFTPFLSERGPCRFVTLEEALPYKIRSLVRV